MFVIVMVALLDIGCVVPATTMLPEMSDVTVPFNTREVASRPLTVMSCCWSIDNVAGLVASVPFTLISTCTDATDFASKADSGVPPASSSVYELLMVRPLDVSVAQVKLFDVEL